MENDTIKIPSELNVQTNSSSEESSKYDSLRKFASALSIKTPPNLIMSATQLGLCYTLGKLTTVPERDVLMEDFLQINIYYFPSSGSNSNNTPPHKFNDFRLKVYAPVAFRYFRKVFGIRIEDFIRSLCDLPLKELSSSGASGSLFFKSSDDLYVLKTVDQREAKFLQCLLPGYYMNLEQNKNTLLPKFFGLYLYSSLAQQFRFVIMNNLLPSYLSLDETYDIKGSTFKRRAGLKELKKASPTFKDLDFLDKHPNGFILDPIYHELVISTLERDARVLASFKIMDYSLLVGVHDVSAHDSKSCLCGSRSVDVRSTALKRNENLVNQMRGLASTVDKSGTFNYYGGVPARNSQGHHILLFIGIIDILQNYRFSKKVEHTFKSIVHDGRAISVNKPSFYQDRFLDFCKKKVFMLSNQQTSPLKDPGIMTAPNVHNIQSNEHKKVSDVFSKPMSHSLCPRDLTSLKPEAVAELIASDDSIQGQIDEVHSDVHAQEILEN